MILLEVWVAWFFLVFLELNAGEIMLGNWWFYVWYSKTTKKVNSIIRSNTEMLGLIFKLFKIQNIHAYFGLYLFEGNISNEYSLSCSVVKNMGLCSNTMWTESQPYSLWIMLPSISYLNLQCLASLAFMYSDSSSSCLHQLISVHHLEWVPFSLPLSLCFYIF